MGVTHTSPLRAFLPLGIALGGRRCVVVGGGTVGTRKVATLAHAGARVTVVAPVLTEELAGRVAAGGVRWIEGPYREEQLEGAFLVVAATGDPTLNVAVAAAAERAGALACNASSGQSSQVIFGALVDHDGATVAVFTDGRDPARSRETRDRIAAHLATDHRRS
jgi:siroheme synthase-like protein